MESAVRAAQPPDVIARGRTRARTPLLRGADAARALDVAERLVAAAIPRLDAASGPPESVESFGGAVLVVDALARAGRAGEESLRAVLLEALVISPDRVSLYDGAGGLLVALDAVDPGRASFTNARSRLGAALAGALRDPAPPDLADSATYDLILGVAGRAVALGADAKDDVQGALRAYAGALADEVERRIVSDDPLVTASVNLGVSHGITGMLAALNAALPHDRGLARRYVEILLACSHDVAGARRWGSVWRRNERPSPRRAWCYQTVGVAAVLDDRARLDGDDALHELAASALRAELEDPDDSRWDAGLCHGRSGVASIAWRFADDERFARYAERLANEVLDGFDAALPLGYRIYDAVSGRYGDRASFLDGALGIAQFLIDAATAQERRWLPLFGLLPD